MEQVTPPPIPATPPPASETPETSFTNLFDFIYRFPLSSLAVLIAILIYEFINLTGTNASFNTLIAIVASVYYIIAIEITAERCPKINRFKYWVIGIPVAYIIGLSFIGSEFPSSWETTAIVSFGMSTVILLVFQPRRRSPLEWNFSSQQITSYVLATITGWLASLIIGIIWGVEEVLLHLSSEKLLFSMLILFVPIAMAVVFLYRVPSDDRPSKFATTFFYAIGLYLLLPLLAIFTFVFLLYLLRLAAMAEIPRGTIGWTVVSWIAIAFAVQYCLSGRHSRPMSNIRLISLRIIPWCGLLLITLFSWSIGYRIHQYGFSPMRAYAILFALWGYGVYGWMLWRGIRHLVTVPLSFAATALLFSIFPYANLTQLCRVAEEESVKLEAVTNEGGLIDTGADSPSEHVAKVPDQAVVVEEVDPARDYKKVRFGVRSEYFAAINIPANVQIVHPFYSDSKIPVDKNGYALLNAESFKTRINVDSILKLDETDPLKPIMLPCTNCPGAWFAITEISIFKTVNDNLTVGDISVATVRGYLFSQKNYRHKKK